MFIRFVVPDMDPHGGFSLAVRRLCLALLERGYRSEVVGPRAFIAHEASGGCGLPVMGLDSLPTEAQGAVADVPGLRRALATGAPDLLVVGYPSVDVLKAAHTVGPTVLHSQMSWLACPDATRHWYRVGKACSVKAGAKCVALRPVLGCSGRRSVLNPTPIVRWARLRELVTSGSIGAMAISGPQAALFREQGVPDEQIAVIPNLTMRMQSDEIADAACGTPEGDRAAVSFFGRLSREKGALLLPELAAAAPPPGLLAFGDGYLAKRLRPVLGTALRGHVSQSRVAGILAWSRATVFPSRWAEPGGIVGLDAQLFGVPLASFAVGAPLDWPATELFDLRATGAMAEWVACQPMSQTPRDPDEIAARQALYWQRVADRASSMLEAFALTGRFPPLQLHAVRDDLRHALRGSVDDRW
jgi:glycosyltransferase involved in cell wall biosynthesis